MSEAFLPSRVYAPVLLATLALCASGCNNSSDHSLEDSGPGSSVSNLPDDKPDSGVVPDADTDMQPCEVGTVCDEYRVCNEIGECAHGCLVDGSYVAHGEVNPSNLCEECNYVQNQLGWTKRDRAACYPPEGSLCDSSEGCTSLHGVSAGEGACAISSGGGLMCWGPAHPSVDGNYQTPVAGLESNVVAVSYGETSFCAVTSAGAVWCGGKYVFGSDCWYDPDCRSEYYDSSGRPIEVAAPGSGIVAVSIGHTATYALTLDGGVVCWGGGCNGDYNVVFEPVPVSGLESGIVDVTSGAYHACALTESGGVVCWGLNWYAQLGDGRIGGGVQIKPNAVKGLESDVVAISAGWEHTCAIKSTGAVVCWGRNDIGQANVAPSMDPVMVPLAVPTLESGVTQISALRDFTCALKTDGAAMCWPYGGGISGIFMGKDDWNDTWWMPLPGFESGVTAVSLGVGHICAEVSGHGVVCLGCNDRGQLGPNAVIGGCVVE